MNEDKRTTAEFTEQVRADLSAGILGRGDLLAQLCSALDRLDRLQVVVESGVGNSFTEELQHLINRFSEENSSDTPDYILASYLVGCLENWNVAVRARDEWLGAFNWDKKAAIEITRTEEEEIIEVMGNVPAVKRIKEEVKIELPHSRACGARLHPHGSECHSNCPTCGGREFTRA